MSDETALRYIAIIRDSVVVSVVVASDSDSLEIIAAVNNADSITDVSELAQRPGPGWLVDGSSFRPPQPYPSWNWEGSEWLPPVPVPNDGSDNSYEWNENTLGWDVVPNEISGD